MAINTEVRSLTVNGTKVAVIDASFSWNRGGKTREPVMGSDVLLGPAESNTAGSCSFDVAYIVGTDLDAFDVTDAQISVTLNQGSTWLMTKAFLASPAEGATGGNITLNYTGAPWVTQTL